MPSTKTKPKSAARSAGPKTKRQHAWRPNNIGQQLKANDKDYLKNRIADFLEYARVDEIHFMLKVLNERDSIGGVYSARGLASTTRPFSQLSSPRSRTTQAPS